MKPSSSKIQVTIIDTPQENNQNGQDKDENIETRQQVESLQALLKEAEEAFADSRQWFGPILSSQDESAPNDAAYQESVQKGIAAIEKSNRLLKTISRRETKAKRTTTLHQHFEGSH
mmetsp:Transcript_33646/g.69980  ORF Transcript_33646/g.69980 Transcript_33646/m.69980 type:complete len:117 (-) Transcript_33646:13-363(-)